MWRSQEEKEEWADDHGYYHWKCRVCGMSGWTDTHPDCACGNAEDEERAEEDEEIA